MRKKLIITIAILLLLTMAAGAFAVHLHITTYITIHDVQYRRDTTRLTLTGSLPAQPEEYARLTELKQLDLTGASVRIGEYDALRAALPDCEILWNVPFQGSTLPHNTTELTISVLSDADILLLDYFPRLTTVHAEGCRDYESLMSLISLRPDLTVTYTVPIGSDEYPRDTAELTLVDADIAQLEACLPYLPQLTHITLEGTLPEAASLIALTERYPQIQFYWQIELFGKTADVYTTELDLSGIPMESVAEVEAAAAYLPAIQKILMMDCGISNEEMGALNDRHEAPLFVWNVVLNSHITLRSDVTTFAPVKLKMTVWDGDLENLKYCTELVVLDLGHMNLWEIDFLSTLTKLEYLIIADTHVRDISPLANLKNLKYLEMFMTRVTDYTPLLECTALEDLNMCYTVGAPDPIMQMTWLKRLWWGGSYMTQDQIQQLKATLSETEIVFPKVGSTDDGWRTGYLYYQMRDLLEMPYLE